MVHLHLHYFSKLKVIQNRSHKTVGINFFLAILLDDGRIRIRISDKTSGSYGFGYGYATLQYRLLNLFRIRLILA
jgi:hypothetical protein